MNNSFIKLSVIMLFISSVLSAQDFQGKAVYQTKTKVEMDLASSGIPADRIKQIEEMMKNQLEKTYELSFNKYESVYKQEEKLEQAGAGGFGGMRVMMMGGGASGVYFKNTQTKSATKENEFSGKNFLVKDALVTYDWKMEQESKMIGEYLCFKATTVIERQARPEFRFGRGNNNQTQDENIEPKMEQVIITAWYAMDIPVSHGPSDYWGLPGLILEINDGTTMMLCTKITINPKEKAVISEPKKGKEMNQKDYDAMVLEKTKEMRERFRNEREKSGGGTHMMRIGG